MADSKHPDPQLPRETGSEGVPTQGRAAPGDAGGLSPGTPDTPDARTPFEPGGPYAEKHPAPQGGDPGPVYPGTTRDVTPKE